MSLGVNASSCFHFVQAHKGPGEEGSVKVPLHLKKKNKLGSSNPNLIPKPSVCFYASRRQDQKEEKELEALKKEAGSWRSPLKRSME